MGVITFEKYLKLTESRKIKYNMTFDKWKLYEQASNDDLDRLADEKADALEKSKIIMQMCQVKILNNFPGYARYLRIMPPTPKHGAGCVNPQTGIGTMETNGSAIYYDPRFVLQVFEDGKADFANEIEAHKKQALSANRLGLRWASDYVCFVIIHEIMHNSLKHFLRKPVPSEWVSRDEIQQLWNLATDYEINHILRDADSRQVVKMVPGGVIADAPKGSPFRAPDGEYDFFATKSAELIFWRLLKDIEDLRKEKQEDDSSDDSPRHVEVGDIIQDSDGGYGRVKSITDDEVEYDEISEEEALREVYGDDYEEKGKTSSDLDDAISWLNSQDNK